MTRAVSLIVLPSDGRNGELSSERGKKKKERISFFLYLESQAVFFVS